MLCLPQRKGQIALVIGAVGVAVPVSHINPFAIFIKEKQVQGVPVSGVYWIVVGNRQVIIKYTFEQNDNGI